MLRFVLLLYSLFAFCIEVDGQINNNLVVFCNDGERFTLIVNGLMENEKPETNVRVVNLDLKVYEVKVIFENPKMKPVNTNITFYRTNKECVFALNKKGRKKHTIDYVSEKDIIQEVVQQPQLTRADSVSKIIDSGTNGSNPPLPTNSAIQMLLNNILLQNTEAGKLSVASNALETMVLNLIDIKSILSLFSSEQTRLAFAKLVWAKLKDPTLYEGILQTFLNTAVKEEFRKFTLLK